MLPREFPKENLFRECQWCSTFLAFRARQAPNSTATAGCRQWETASCCGGITSAYGKRVCGRGQTRLSQGFGALHRRRHVTAQRPPACVRREGSVGVMRGTVNSAVEPPRGSVSHSPYSEFRPRRRLPAGHLPTSRQGTWPACLVRRVSGNRSKALKANRCHSHVGMVGFGPNGFTGYGVCLRPAKWSLTGMRTRTDYLRTSRN